MPLQKLLERGVLTIPPDASCLRAARAMRDERVGCLVVAEGRKPLDLVTDRDLTVRVLAEGRDPEATLVREVMSDRPAFVIADRSLEDAMAHARVRRLPVVDEDGMLEGLIALDDVWHHLSSRLGGPCRILDAESPRTETQEASEAS